MSAPKKLVDDLLLKSPEGLLFKSMLSSEKDEYISRVIDEAFDYIGDDKYRGWEEIDKNDKGLEIYLGNTISKFVLWNEILSSMTHDYLMGWNHKHGNVHFYFENYGMDSMFVSIYSDNHPEKTNREKWNFNDLQKKYFKFTEIEPTENNKTCVADYLKSKK